jgi:hypothetical protein
MNSIKDIINKMPDEQLDQFAASVQQVQGNLSPSINGSGSEDTPEITAAKAKVAELNAEGSTATDDEKVVAQKALDDVLAAGKIPGPGPDAAAAAGEGENALPDAGDSEKSGEVATLVIPEGQKMDIDGKYGTANDDTFKFGTIDELNTARTTQEPALEALTKKDIEKLNAPGGGRRRTRRHHKKGDKKSRRQSKKGGKKHRKSAKKGSSKSKRSRRYSSRK